MRFFKISLFSSTLILLSLFSVLITEAYFIEWFPTYQQTFLMRLYHQCADEETATAWAQADFETGNYRLIFYGMPEQTSIRKADILHEKYNISVIYPGCISWDVGEWYTQAMINLLSEKYGCDFIQTLREDKSDSVNDNPALTIRSKSLR